MVVQREWASRFELDLLAPRLKNHGHRDHPRVQGKRLAALVCRRVLSEAVDHPLEFGFLRRRLLTCQQLQTDDILIRLWHLQWDSGAVGEVVCCHRAGPISSGGNADDRV